MSNCLIVVDSNNADRNSLGDIAAAVADLGGVVAADQQGHCIEAAIPSHELPVVKAMDGVSYIRCIFQYFRGMPPRRAA